MKKTVIIGAAGRMGKALVRCLSEGSVADLELVGAVDLGSAPGQGRDIGGLAGVSNLGINLTDNLPALLRVGEVFIDFSFHTGIKERAGLMKQVNAAWVIGTTGLDDQDRHAVAAAAATIPIVLSPNMSLGVNLLSALVQQAAAILKDKGYDIEIVERHHRKKLDAPSGTALFLGEAAARGSQWDLNRVARHGRSGVSSRERPEEEIGFHAVRGGDFAGDHTVIFAGEGESVELSHRATSRDTFAVGALRAASWVAGREPGLYAMKDVLGL